MASNNDDNWQRAVELITGYHIPDRKTLFDKLKGNDDIPLMHVRLDTVSYYRRTEGFISTTGLSTHGSDYTIAYYTPKGDGTNVGAGSDLEEIRVHITFLAMNTGAVPPKGSDIITSFEKTSNVLKDKGGWNKEGDKLDWNTTALTQYMYGSGEALAMLTTWPHSTHGYSSRGIDVNDGSYVDLLSMTQTAKAFDRAVKFFTDGASTMSNWDNEQIGEGSDKWDGTSARIFQALVHKLARNYESYAEQLAGKDAGNETGLTIDNFTVSSKPARAIADAQTVILNQAKSLYDAWKAWKLESNPQHILYDLLQQARLELFDNQYDKTDIGVTTSSPPYTYTEAKEGFKNDITIYGKSYGKPSDMNTWKAIGEEAVRRWNDSVQQWLSAFAAGAIVEIGNALKEAEAAFDTSITDKDKRPLSEIAAKVEADAEKAKTEAENAKAKAEAEAEKQRLIDEQNKAKAEAEAQRLKDKAEAEAQRAKDKAEAEAEKAKAKQEQEQEKAEAKAEKEKEKAEAEKEKAQAKQEQEQEKAEAKAEQDKEKAEAKAEQEKAKQEQEQEQEKAEAKAEQEKAKQEAEQEKAEAKAEQQQEKAEAKAEQEQAKQEQQQQQAQVLLQNQQAQAEAKRDRDQQKAEQEQEKAEAKAEQEKAKQEAEQEKAEAKAEQQ
ncbi:AAWKG family protein, partial [Streptomyces tendae]|uniref:AAWKG family protein n=1 Tax=Streptomyces tendae TaxID=1932 RepID=UPI0037A5F2E5